ncbi:hypothetical protein ACQ4PT_009409 [Festuca glaucescens]
MEEGTGARMVPGGSPRLHPQIQASADGAGVTCRSSPCLHPQIQANEDGTGMMRRRSRDVSPAAPDSLPDDDDLLREILLRLPPQPSSLPRASAVCRRWRGLVTDPRFLRAFRAHHRKPPLLGMFELREQQVVFTPILDPPDRVPAPRLSLGRYSNRGDYGVLNCRHGLVLVQDWLREEVVVCDPITGEQSCVGIPPEFRRTGLAVGGAVLCAASQLGHVHGGCHLSPFKVVLVFTEDSRALASVYSSKTGVWSNLIPTPAPCELFDASATLVGNAVYWLSEEDRIIEFDLDGQTLDVITGPPVTNDIIGENYRIIQGENGAVGFAILSLHRLQTWQRKVNRHGVAMWVQWKAIEMHTIRGLPSPIEGVVGWLLGYDEDNGVIILYVDGSVYTVQLMSMQSRKLYETHNKDDCHPFASFFAPGDCLSLALMS